MLNVQMKIPLLHTQVKLCQNEHSNLVNQSSGTWMKSLFLVNDITNHVGNYKYYTPMGISYLIFKWLFVSLFLPVNHLYYCIFYFFFFHFSRMCVHKVFSCGKFMMSCIRGVFDIWYNNIGTYWISEVHLTISSLCPIYLTFSCQTYNFFNQGYTQKILLC